jgi:AhpD family alkylhydroperoxidase
MSVSYVEREQANEETLAFYDAAEDRFQALLNIFKVLGHQPEYGTVFTNMIMAILKDGVIDWKTKELLILKATQRNDCQYCVVQHERVSDMLGIPPEKVADIDGDKYKTSPHFTEAEKALLDYTVQIGEDANRVPKELCGPSHRSWMPHSSLRSTSQYPSSATPWAWNSNPCSMGYSLFSRSAIEKDRCGPPGLHLSQ